MRSIIAAGLTLSLALPAAAKPAKVTFTKDVAPILQKHCQSCHRPGQIGPMPLLTYQQTRPWAAAIKEAVSTKRMPPWYADRAHGTWANDRSLTQPEIDTLVAWAGAKAPEGKPKDLPKPAQFADGWLLGKPDAEFGLLEPFPVPASGEINYQYFMVPTGLTEDKWIQSIEFHPGDPAVVHHVVIFMRPPGLKFLPNAKPGIPIPVPNSRLRTPVADDGKARLEGLGEPEILGTYTPGGSTQVWAPGHAKLIKAGTDLMFQMHYTATGKASADQSRVGLFWAKEPPQHRVRSIFISNRKLSIPAGAPNHEVKASATLPSDVTVTGLFPHMHVRGKAFQYKVTYPTGESEILLSVPNYDFNWQLHYYPAKALRLPKGTVVECTAWYDNSPNKKGNPDPTVEVRWGDQSWEEMLAGFLDIVVPIEPARAVSSGE
ncbi:MAG: c-type cytochrome [Bryobacteraceae bacterium]